MSASQAATITDAVTKLNAGDAEGYARTLYSDDAQFHGFPEGVEPTRSGIIAFFTALVEAVPDLTIAAQDMLAEGDRVALRFTMTGTHQGELMGAPGTGKTLCVEGITMLRFADGRVIERWNRLDELALLGQLGLLPAAAAA